MRFGQPSGLQRTLGFALRSSAVALVASVASSAFAEPGEHIRVGDMTITPEVGVGFEYRSNAFRADTTPQGTGALRVAPGLTMAAATPEVEFSLDANYALRKFLFLTNSDTLTEEQIQNRITSLDRFNEFSFGASLDGLRTKSVGFQLQDRALLRNNPNDTAIDSDDPYATQLANVLSGGMTFRPGPALNVGLNGNWNHTVFFIPDPVEDQRVAFNVRDRIGPSLDVKWMFFPKTAFVFNAAYNTVLWADEAPANGAVVVPNSHQVKVDTGVHGRLSEKLRLLARVGFGTQLFAEGPNLNPGKGVLFTLQGDYDVTQEHKITLGYRKNFAESFFTNSVAMNALYGRWKGKYAERLSSTLELGTRFESYDGATERNDIVTQLNAGVQYGVQPWMTLGVDGGWIQRSSTDDQVEYDDVRAMANARFVY